MSFQFSGLDSRALTRSNLSPCPFNTCTFMNVQLIQRFHSHLLCLVIIKQFTLTLHRLYTAILAKITVTTALVRILVYEV